MEIIVIVALVAVVIIVGHILGPVAGAIDADWVRKS